MFLAGSLAGMAALQRSLRAERSPGPARTLVLVQLTGGHDGASMLVPYAHDAYHAARKATRIEPQDVLRIDERVGLHPRLERLAELHEHGRLAWFEGIGPPETNRSHFRSMDVWHAGDPRGRLVEAGWIGRCIERLESPAPHSVVHLGVKPPFSLYCPRHSPLCLTPALMRLTEPGRPIAREASLHLDEEERMRAEEGGSETTVAATRMLEELMSEAESSAALLHAALQRRRNGRMSYPSSGLAQDLRNAAALIHADLGVRVVSVELNGFDTHRDQRNRHDRLMAELDGALGAFWQDLTQSEAGRETLVLLFSEFGRRFEENASGGTDHGAGGLGLALGARVRGGLYGVPPSLDALVDGDLAVTTDFRSVYAGCIEHVFDVPPESVLGAPFPALGFV